MYVCICIHTHVHKVCLLVCKSTSAHGVEWLFVSPTRLTTVLDKGNSNPALKGRLDYCTFGGILRSDSVTWTVQYLKNDWVKGKKCRDTYDMIFNVLLPEIFFFLLMYHVYVLLLKIFLFWWAILCISKVCNNANIFWQHIFMNKHINTVYIQPVRVHTRIHKYNIYQCFD